jgi:hypothetical protein
MPADLLVLRAARNAFLFVLLALVGVSTYQFATIGSIEPGIAVIWVVGAGGFYASKWYYRRNADPEAEGADTDAAGGDVEAAGGEGDEADAVVEDGGAPAESD